MNTLHFVAITNERFCPGMLALIRSTQAHNPRCRFTTLQLSSTCVPQPWLDRFVAAGAEVLVIDGSPIERAIAEGAGDGRHRYGPETYAKFLLQDYFDEPFWWLDTDMIMQRPFELDDPSSLGGIAAIAPYREGIERTFRGLEDPTVMARFRELADIDRVLSERVAFNGGVLWMSPRRIRETDLRDRALRVVRRVHDHLVHADESIFNLIRYGYDLRVLPEYIQEFSGYDIPYVYPSDRPPLVKHYMGVVKPWMGGYPHTASIADYRRWLSADEFDPILAQRG